MHHGLLLPCCPAHTQERRFTESLQQRLAGSQQQLLETRQEAASRWEGGDDGCLLSSAAKACNVGGWTGRITLHLRNCLPVGCLADPCRLAEAEAELRTGREEAARRAAAAESMAAEARARVEQLAEEAQNLRDAVK